MTDGESHGRESSGRFQPSPTLLAVLDSVVRHWPGRWRAIVPLEVALHGAFAQFERVGLKPTPSYLESIPRVLRPSTNVLLIAPFERIEDRATIKRLGLRHLHEAALRSALDEVGRECVVVAVVPASLLKSARSETRAAAFAGRFPNLIVEGSHAWPMSMGISSRFSLTVVGFEPAKTESPLCRFLRLGGDVEPEVVERSLDQLLGMDGGSAENWMVIREPPAILEPVVWERLHPDFIARREELSAFGDARPLESLVERQATIPLVRPRRGQSDETPVDRGGTPVIEGRAISVDGIDHDLIRTSAVVDSRLLLAAGDICMREIASPENRTFPVVELGEADLPLVASNRVLVLRPKPELSDVERRLLLTFLRSQRFRELLAAEGWDLHVIWSRIAQVPVPVPDARLHHAIEELDKASEALATWADEIEAAQGELFTKPSAREAYQDLVASSEIVRQRVASARLLDDLDYRVRTRYPLPIAWRWRTLEGVRGTQEKTEALVKCYETLICYLGLLSLKLAHSAQTAIAAWDQVKAALSHGRGPTLGDWVNVLQEASGGQFRQIAVGRPLSEVTQFLRDPELNDRQLRLTALRNDRAHDRPPADGTDEDLLDQALQDLRALLDGASFITNYPLVLVEDTSWDALSQQNVVTYRELTGDHPVAPLSDRVVATPEIESSSLYLLDPGGTMILLRPFLHATPCPTCGLLSTFRLERFDSDGAPELKSLEHGHVVSRPGDLAALQAVGLIHGEGND